MMKCCHHHHYQRANDEYAVETKSQIELVSFGGFLGAFGAALTIAGLVVTKLVHATFGPVGVGVGVYCVAVGVTLVLERRNSKRKLVYVRDIYTSAMRRQNDPQQQQRRKRRRMRDQRFLHVPHPSFDASAEEDELA